MGKEAPYDTRDAAGLFDSVCEVAAGFDLEVYAITERLVAAVPKSTYPTLEELKEAAAPLMPLSLEGDDKFKFKPHLTMARSLYWFIAYMGKIDQAIHDGNIDIRLLPGGLSAEGRQRDQEDGSVDIFALGYIVSLVNDDHVSEWVQDLALQATRFFVDHYYNLIDRHPNISLGRDRLAEILAHAIVGKGKTLKYTDALQSAIANILGRQRDIKYHLSKINEDGRVDYHLDAVIYGMNIYRETETINMYLEKTL